MSGDVGAIAAAALGIAVSPIPFLLALGLLGTDRPIRNAGLFVSGEAFAVSAISSVLVLAVADGDGLSASVASGIAVLELVVGLLVAGVLAVHLRRSRADSRPPWARALDGVGVVGAFAAGVAMIAANPKNLTLTIAGAAAIVRPAYTPAMEAVSVAVFAATAVSLLCVLLTIAVATPQRATELVDRTEVFVLAHERALVGAALAVVSAYFLVHGATSLPS